MVLRFLVKHLSLSRRPSESKSIFCPAESRKKLSSNNVNVSEVHKHCLLDNLMNDNCIKLFPIYNPKFKNSFVRSVKPKKRCEILKMAHTMSEIAKSLQVNHIVDVGSGLGHLSRICSYGFGLNVLSIESQAAFCKEAKKLDLELETTICKYLTAEEIEVFKNKRPIHVQKSITNDMSPDVFIQFIRKAFNLEENSVKFGIVGLHPCGNLASKLIHLFNLCEDIKFMSIVGCCYHKITAESQSSGENNFPVSNFCQEKNMQVSYEARALACHALENYSQRLQASDYEHLKIHCYRAALERIIAKNWPDMRKTPMNNVKHGSKLTFPLYCESALKKQQLLIPEEDVRSDDTLKCLSEWKNVVFYYSMRLILAPLVETLILSDRLLFLIEKGYECELKAIFEPEVSPRNFILIARKEH